MTLSLADTKLNKIKTILTDCLCKYNTYKGISNIIYKGISNISLRELARILGSIVASFRAVTYGPLHYSRGYFRSVWTAAYQF